MKTPTNAEATETAAELSPLDILLAGGPDAAAVLAACAPYEAPVSKAEANRLLSIKENEAWEKRAIAAYKARPRTNWRDRYQ